ncbi:hypothetical protein [Burkholderia ubonensis]|uniref:hypothetical protein n=1 Tax=Burkholderia ubonensis TaxID=101571 RepID=UPI000759D678|nr:hypothetical protein [Burkholderia ubonensis]KVO11762.1 hypothetical protein WJ73_19650 [Burkholderia ubonensis]
MTTQVTKEQPIERYSLRGDHGVWATIALRGWEATSASGDVHHCGEILINSDYGNYAYAWGSMGCPLKQFLIEIDRGYLLNKLAGLSLYEFDFDASVERVKREILQQRRDGSLDRDEAREAWNDIPSDNQGKDLFINELFRIDCLGEEPWHFAKERERPELGGFYKHVWTPFTEHLRAELAAEVVSA